VHLEVARLHKQGYEIVMIGHKGHPEVEGTMGQATGGMHLVENVADVALLAQKVGADDTARESLKLAYVTQTTLSVDDTNNIVAALQQQFPSIVGPKKDDICYATQNRQDAVKAMASRIDVMIVVGSKNSSNSNRLREVAETEGIPAYLVDDAEHISPAWLIGKNVIGVTAGASAPEVLVNGVIARLKTLGAHDVALLDGVVENVTFALPKELA